MISLLFPYAFPLISPWFPSDFPVISPFFPISLLFPYDFRISSRLFPYYFQIFVVILSLSITSLFFPYYFPMMCLFYSYFFPILSSFFATLLARFWRLHPFILFKIVQSSRCWIHVASSVKRLFFFFLDFWTWMWKLHAAYMLRLTLQSFSRAFLKWWKLMEIVILRKLCFQGASIKSKTSFLKTLKIFCPAKRKQVASWAHCDEFGLALLFPTPRVQLGGSISSSRS